MASAYQKIKLLQGLLTGEYAHTGPFHAVVGLTSRCNLRCVGCRYHSVFAQRQKITDETFTIEESGKMGLWAGNGGLIATYQRRRSKLRAAFGVPRQ